VSRRPRIPGMSRPRDIRLEVATGGNPTRAFLRAAMLIPWRPGEVWLTDVHHDDGCPATPDGPMAACSCEIVELRARRAA
jgi:hypothetical protein